MTAKPPGDRLRVLAAWLCSPATVERILEPVIADLRHEHAEAIASGRKGLAAWCRLRGTAAFWQAVAAHSARATFEPLPETQVLSNGRRYGTLSLCIALSFLALCSAFVVHNALSYPWFFATIPAALPWLLPSIALVALPMSVLLGVALGTRHLSPAGRPAAATLMRPATVLSCAAGVATFALGAVVTPRANQAYREIVLRSIVGRPTARLAKGDREMTLSELSRGIADAPPGKRSGYRVELHKKFAIPAACVLSGLLAGVVFVRRGVHRPIAVVLWIVVTWLGWWACLRFFESWARAGDFPPLLAAWSGNLTLVAALALMIRRNHRGASYLQSSPKP